MDDLPGDVSFVDLSVCSCVVDVCPPAIGNVLVYLDDNHLTATYLTTMSAVLADAIDAAMGWGTTPAPVPSTT